MRIIIRNLTEDEYSTLLSMKKTFNCNRWDELARVWIKIYSKYISQVMLREHTELTEIFEEAAQVKRKKKIHTWRGLK